MYYTYFLLGVNSFMCLLGFLMVCMGMYIICGISTSGLLADAISTNGSLLLFLGILLMLNSFYGLYTLFTENLGLIALQGVFLVFTMLSHFWIAIYSFLELRSVENTYEAHAKNLKEAYKDAYTDNDEKAQTMVENLQRNLRCCGADSHQDFFKIHNKTYLPASCCEQDKLPCTNPYVMGCINALVEKTESDLRLGGWLSSIVIFIPVFGIPFIYRQIKKMMSALPEDEEEEVEHVNL